jgi:hypothetical protein
MAVTTFDDILDLTAHLPGVTESTSYGTPALKVRGKSVCRLCPLLIEMSGGSLFTTAHYDGHGAVLIRLEDIPRHELAERLEESYLLKAPPSLRKTMGRR